MCQPQKPLKKAFTIPPRKEHPNNATIVTSELTSSKSKGLTVNPKKELKQSCKCNTSNNSCSLPEIDQQGNHEGIVNGLNENKSTHRMVKGNELQRRNSYESLDVIDGRAITPVNTTARQRLLKVYLS